MKILLISPICYDSMNNFINDVNRIKINIDEPIGLMYISAYIKKELPEVDIEIYDYFLECLKLKYNSKSLNEIDCNQLLYEKLESYKPNIIGISALYEYNKDIIFDLCKKIKLYNPYCKIVLGGILPTTNYINDVNIDYVVKGEGEIYFKEYIEYELGLRKWEDINGGMIEKYDFLPDRSNLSIGYYSIFGRSCIDRFYRENCKVATIQIDRGCPFFCRYCSGHCISKRKFRTRKIKSIIDEIIMLKDKYYIEVFQFNSENAVVNKKYTKKLLKEIIKLNIKWVHLGGWYVHLIDEEIIKLAIESGLVMFNLAIESGSKRILKLVKKSEKIVDDAENIVNIIRKYSKNIYITAFFLSGFPFETWNDFELSKQLANKLDIDWIFWNVYQPFKGSELYDYCIENKHLDLNNENNKAHYTNSQLKNTTIDMDELSKKIYDFQLDFNFNNNRCMINGNYDQAKRDFQHVLNITDGKHEQAKKMIDRIIFEENNIDE